MANFNLSLNRTLSHEGNYRNDPSDNGGETYKGIARKSHPDWAGWTIIDKCKKATDFPLSLEKSDELQKLVVEVYYHQYWQPLKADQILKQSVADSIFDFAVNAGVNTSIEIVQKMLRIKIDGLVGTESISHINAEEENHFLSTLTVKKLKYYMDTIRRRPTNKKFLLGWLSRSLSFNN